MLLLLFIMAPDWKTTSCLFKGERRIIDWIFLCETATQQDKGTDYWSSAKEKIAETFCSSKEAGQNILWLISTKRANHQSWSIVQGAWKNRGSINCDRPKETFGGGGKVLYLGMWRWWVGSVVCLLCKLSYLSLIPRTHIKSRLHGHVFIVPKLGMGDRRNPEALWLASLVQISLDSSGRPHLNKTKVDGIRGTVPEIDL